SAAARDLLDQAVLRPVVRVVGNPAALFVEDGCDAAVQLRVVDELGLAPPCGRGGHRPAVELVPALPRRGARADGKAEAVALTPGVRSQRETVLARESHRKAARRENERLLGTCLEVSLQGVSGLDGARRAD